MIIMGVVVKNTILVEEAKKYKWDVVRKKENDEDENKEANETKIYLAKGYYYLGYSDKVCLVADEHIMYQYAARKYKFFNHPFDIYKFFFFFNRAFFISCALNHSVVNVDISDFLQQCNDG